MWRGSSRAFAAAVVLISGSALANLPTRAVVLSGEPIPGHDPFKTFRDTTAIAINNHGQVLFEGRDESDGALWLGNPDGSRTLLHHIYDPAPGFPTGFELGNAYRGFIYWYLNDSGQTTISSGVFDSVNGGGSESIVWLAQAGSLTPVARQSQPPVGLVGNVSNVWGLHLNETGSIVAWYVTNPIASTGTVAAGKPGALEIIAQNVGQYPQAMIDDAGEVAFLGSRNGTNGIWFGPPSNMKLLASGSSLYAPYVSKNGHLAYSANGALYVAAPGSSPTAVLHNGDPAPGRPGSIIETPRNLSITDTGYVSFEASISGGPGGYWAGLPGAIRPLALEGDPAPADIPGMTFKGVSNSLIFINNSGEALFYGYALDPLTSATEAGLWASDSVGVLHLVVRENGPLQFDGQMRTVSAVGIRYGVDDAGEIAFVAQFTDGSSGVFLSTIPEPSTFCLLAPILVLSRRRSRCSMGT